MFSDIRYLSRSLSFKLRVVTLEIGVPVRVQVDSTILRNMGWIIRKLKNLKGLVPLKQETNYNIAKSIKHNRSDLLLFFTWTLPR